MLILKKVKKMLAFTLVFLLSIVSLTINAKASSNPPESNIINSKSESINEYQMIVNEEKEVDKKIEDLNIEKSNNNNLVDYDKKLKELNKEKTEAKQMYKKLDEHIKSLKKRSKEDLEKVRYTPQQIEAIQNYDGSEEMMALASARLIISASPSLFYRDTTTKYIMLKVYYLWTWNGIPANMYTDCIAAAWSQGFTNYDNNHSISYYRWMDNTFSEYGKYSDINLNSPQTMQFTFPMGKYWDTAQMVYADHGEGYIYLKKYDPYNMIKDINFKVVYGHEVFSMGFTAGFDIITGSFGVELSPKKTTEEIKTDPEWGLWSL